MCGVFGFVSKEQVTTAAAKQALRTLTRRGPDVEGIKEFNNNNIHVFLGFRRLAIIDLSPAGNQPMTDRSGNYTLIFNGEIYNYQELRKDLEKRGYTFSSMSDSETILYGYIHYGYKIVEKLEGMFAFAIYDRKKQLVTIARDHFGKKPMYYYFDNERLLFSSELKAFLVNPKWKGLFKLSQESIVKFLMYGYIPSPGSIFSNVYKLEPSTTLQFSIDKWKIINKYRYWKLEASTLNKNISFEESMVTVNDLLQKAVKKRLVADVPLGSFLSGGVDSSLVTAIASQYAPGIETFSVIYDDKKFDESEYAKMVGERFDIKYNFFKFEDRLALPLLEEVLEYMDEPMADASLLPTTFVAKQTRKKVTVALSGDGGDELFGGYAKYRAQLLTENLSKLQITKLEKLLKTVLGMLPVDMTYKEGLRKLITSLRYAFPIRHFILGSGSFSLDELDHVISDKTLLDPKLIFSESIFYADQFGQEDLGNKLLYLDQKIQLPDWYLVKADRASMSQSLEVRSPLLDKELATFVMSLPSKYKFNTKDSKILLKAVSEKYLPEQVIHRKKMGFGLPLNKWMKQNFRKLADESIVNFPLDIINKKYINNMWLEFTSDKFDHGTKLWRIFILSRFLKKYGYL